MKHSEFRIGEAFWCGGHEWRRRDIGIRTIVAIQVDEVEMVVYAPGPPETAAVRTLNRSQAEEEGWFHGPPYAVDENVFDEYGIPPVPSIATAMGQTLFLTRCRSAIG